MHVIYLSILTDLRKILFFSNLTFITNSPLPKLVMEILLQLFILGFKSVNDKSNLMKIIFN